MDEHRESHSFCGEKRVLSVDLSLDSRYQPPEFTTISAAKARKKRPKKPTTGSKKFKKSKSFRIEGLFLTDG